jgi:hypothetical protein
MCTVPSVRGVTAEGREAGRIDFGKTGVGMREMKEPEVIGGYRVGRRLDVAGSAETYEATGPEGEVVVLRALQKDPVARYQSVDEMRRALVGLS